MDPLQLLEAAAVAVTQKVRYTQVLFLHTPSSLFPSIKLVYERVSREMT